MLSILGLALVCTVPFHTAAAEESPLAEQNRYNVLMICIDDLRNELGCYGVEEVSSPNIDRLADSSITFSNHYVQVPTCGASRYALLTGRRPSSSKGMSNNAFHNLGKGKSKDLSLSLPENFKRSDYTTVTIGKVSHTPDSKNYRYNGSGPGTPEIPNAWTEMDMPYGPWKYGWGCFFAYDKGKHREDKSGYRPVMEFPDVKDNELPDGQNCEHALKKLEQLKKQKKPFFLAVGFYKPHLPFVAPKKYRDIYNDVDVKDSAVVKRGNTAYAHRSGEFYGYHMPNKPLTAEDRIQTKKAYYACVSYTDALVGRLLDKLKELDLEKNTIVVLWSDHGWFLGEHAIWGKHSPLERSVQSPLMIRVPGKAGGMTSAVVETLDVYPTLLDLCQLSDTQTAFPLGGSSLTPVLDKPEHAGKNAAISYWGKSRSVRSGQYRLIATRQGKNGWTKRELYDHSQDPEETHNLISKKPEVAERLLKLLDADAPILIK
ncbi:sulfatase [Verrucomicrobiaceae bacterium N1E253]|uniref:Sulfatase n=2 Tax=Oceaniferula marina TaxID=2748318 RepID=A0A851GK50_9BACT|nr:sulfatase [Oceaniferula marina]